MNGKEERVDYIIVGQGICGSLLSWYLQQEGKTVLVLDEQKENSASKVAAGIINPVTGRRYVSSWMIDELIPFALNAYEEIGTALNTHFIQQKDLIDFFPSAQMRDAFVNRIAEDDTYLRSYPDQNQFNQYFQYDFGCGLVHPVYMVHLSLLLVDWQKKLKELNSYRAETLDCSQLQVYQDSIRYKNISAEKIIFCDGINGLQNPFFRLLPFSAVKGEALVIECPDLPSQHIFKKGIMLAPLPVQHTYWVGSNYLWEFADEQPTEKFHQQTVAQLQQWLKVPFRVLQQKAAVRPATLERRPFVGLHPQQPAVGILNGMGTKGSSLAPYFAHQLAQHLVHGLPLLPEADVQRFSKVLRM